MAIEYVNMKYAHANMHNIMNFANMHNMQYAHANMHVAYVNMQCEYAYMQCGHAVSRECVCNLQKCTQ